MKAFRTPFEMEVDVTFEEPEKAENYFIKGGDWKSYFWTVANLAELSAHISYAFHFEGEQWNKELKSFTKFVEGFGRFVKNDDGTWRTTDQAANDGGGHICIKYSTELTTEDAYDIAV